MATTTMFVPIKTVNRIKRMSWLNRPKYSSAEMTHKENKKIITKNKAPFRS